MILASIIRIIHIMLILFILIAPFSSYAPILILHLTGAWCLLVHWAANNDICFLTLVESKLRNIDYRKGFLHKFVSPVYNITDKKMSELCHIMVILSMLVASYNLFESTSFDKARKCYMNNGSLIDCFKILFDKRSF